MDKHSVAPFAFVMSVGLVFFAIYLVFVVFPTTVRSVKNDFVNKIRIQDLPKMEARLEERISEACSMDEFEERLTALEKAIRKKHGGVLDKSKS